MSSSGITCSACLSGTIKPGTPTGTVTSIYGRPTYVTKPELKDGEKAKGVVVIVPDIFGWEISNARLLADAYAREGGWVVLLPDFMDGLFRPIFFPLIFLLACWFLVGFYYVFTCGKGMRGEEFAKEE